MAARNWAPNGAAGTQAVAVDPAFHATAGPLFHVLGDLNLNGGANVNFNCFANNTDEIQVGGALEYRQHGHGVRQSQQHGRDLWPGDPL